MNRSNAWLQCFWELCLGCAKDIHGAVPPNERYTLMVAKLLAMTAAHESGGFRWNRQLGFRFVSGRGAYGLWQLEAGSITDSIRYLRRKPKVAEHAAVWLFQNEKAPTDWHRFVFSADSAPKPVLFAGIIGWRRLACLFARLHYLRVPEAVPFDINAQGAYAKKYYNTVAGKATPEDYVDAYERHIVPLWEGDV